ncbi:protein NEDD1-like [Chenopodium quinoa]|uniref:protein NEDD1-like n=1 Tax=Chenopodium quinoa TaxID=63459 RepID=UPI000B770C12|nr:protein NEDD1-like [Chenopodium quinoa]
MVLLAASGGDTVKLFDVSVESGDPCSLSYTPSPGFQVNSVKWNHTNLVVASAGDDKKITLWRKNGQSMGTIPLLGSESGDNVEEAISSISFSNKSSRYLCSGGSGQVVRIWDLQRKRCIKWLKGHTGSISSAMYNCKDEHLASISTNGDLLVHNLASGSRAAELKDPHGQMLRVLDYSRVSRHLLATAGDDGSVHLWDTTGRSPKVSWLKQHSAPTAGLSFSPSNDKMIATVGLDKKLYTFDSGTKRSSFCISYEAPFSSLAFREDGWILAAGTSNGRVVFYDVRGKPQPFTVLRAYGHSEAVTSLCWQRSKPIDVNEKNCTADIALLGGAVEDSILMPDPLPSATLTSAPQATTFSGPRRSSSAVESSFAATFTNNNQNSEETPHRSSLRTGGVLPRLQATRNYNFKDDMDVFSPLLDVPITPSLDKLWNDNDLSRKDQPGDKKVSPLFPNRKFTLPEAVNDIHPIFDWKPGPAAKQDDFHSSLPGSTPTASSRSEDSSIIPPEAWGGERLSDKIALHRQSLASRLSMSTSTSTSTSTFTGLQDPSASQSALSYSTSTSLISNFRAKDTSSGQENSPGTFGHVPFSALLNVGSKPATGQANPEAIGSLNPSRRFSTYAERIGSSAAFTDGVSASLGSPKTKKTGVETREELQNSLLARSDTTYAAEPGLLPSVNGAPNLHQRTPQADLQHRSSNFTLQLFQHTLQETLSSFQKSIHEDVRNLHIEILRQFHMQETEVSGFMNRVVDKLDSLTEEIQALKKENERLRQLL